MREFRATLIQQHLLGEKEGIREQKKREKGEEEEEGEEEEVVSNTTQCLFN